MAKTQKSDRDAGDPVLVLSPVAWLKWQYLCHAGPTEVSALAVTAADDPLYVESLVVPAQECNAAYTEMDADSVSDWLDHCAGQEIHPGRFGRVWLHTHPGDSAQPSGTDEATFAGKDGLGQFSHAVMAILARGGETYCRLRVKAVDIDVIIPVRVDWARFPRDLEAAGGLPHEKWLDQYTANVRERKWVWEHPKKAAASAVKDRSYWETYYARKDEEEDLVSLTDAPPGTLVRDHYPADVIEQLGLDPDEPWDPEDDEWVLEYLDEHRREDYLAARQGYETPDAEDLADRAQKEDL